MFDKTPHKEIVIFQVFLSPQYVAVISNHDYSACFIMAKICGLEQLAEPTIVHKVFDFVPIRLSDMAQHIQADYSCPILVNQSCFFHLSLLFE